MLPEGTAHEVVEGLGGRDVGVQDSETRFKLKALLSFSQSNFETGCFQARIELAPPHRGEGTYQELSPSAKFGSL